MRRGYRKGGNGKKSRRREFFNGRWEIFGMFSSEMRLSSLNEMIRMSKRGKKKKKIIKRNFGMFSYET